VDLLGWAHVNTGDWLAELNLTTGNLVRFFVSHLAGHLSKIIRQIEPIRVSNLPPRPRRLAIDLAEELQGILLVRDFRLLLRRVVVVRWVLTREGDGLGLLLDGRHLGLLLEFLVPLGSTPDASLRLELLPVVGDVLLEIILGLVHGSGVDLKFLALDIT